MIRVAGFVQNSIVDGPGIRSTIFVQGCEHHCKGCHNPETWPFEGGTMMSVEELLAKVQEEPLLDGVTISGGDPIYAYKELMPLVEKLSSLGYNIWCYTGFLWEELLEKVENDDELKHFLFMIDTIVDGPFRLEERDLTLEWRGSRNQRIIHCKTLMENLYK